MDRMIANFFTRARTQSGYFLDIPRAAMSYALSCSIELWAVHLTRAESTVPTPEAEFEIPYLRKTLSAASDALTPSSSRPPPISHIIQAHVLLCNYFFRNVRIVEGKYHLATAVGLVVGAGLHKRDHQTTTERIKAFWTVYALDCCWAVADGSSSNFPGHIQDEVDIPWPNEAYAAAQGQGTISAFLDLTLVTSNATSFESLRTKAATLLERAAKLVSNYQYATSPDDRHLFSLSFMNLDAIIQRFRQSLQEYPAEQLPLLLACMATIQLHSPFAFALDPDPEAELSRRRIFDAARDIIGSFDGLQLGLNLVDPIIGTLLTAACRVLLSTIGFQRSHRPESTGPHLRRAPQPIPEPVLHGAVDRVLAIMASLAPGCKIIDAQMNMMREAYRLLA
ncbi:hypothetical protein MIND_01098100 [Mycena indigotica]|uniref:Xylanolytic transcriptional activator regulatory domain-containing protein n=1 Tax=Mycena indigotica TaxID=2126181 RepID=A0A8H6S9Q7_9AGAR|nr:uncharacterized protein MIND_01098100 [Mycena indigotica]KAF7295581.1 hypothetical protein MIND_01098100 [Mycena indigotica]